MGLIAQLRKFHRAISTCPHPDKLRFYSRADAEKSADRIGLNVYECVCGMWHMTGQCSSEPECPICGAPLDEWNDCGCYAELHWGGD